MIIEIRKLHNGKNSEGVKLLWEIYHPFGILFRNLNTYFYNHINPSDLIIGSQLRNS